jgi:DNA polymerase-3 subunit epsilon
MLNPGVPIPDEAAAIHGVTTEIAQAGGADPEEGLALILAKLEARPPGTPVVVFNARYDLTVLDREARRYGLTPLQDRGPLLVVDPLVIDKWLDRYRKGSRKLEAICAHYGAKLDDAHDAAFDAVAAARLAWALAERGRVIRRVRNGGEALELAALEEAWSNVRHDLGKLHIAQIGWAREQAEGLREHFRKAGNPDADRVEVDWPLIPARVPA